MSIRIAFLIEYNGKRFCGSQYQAGVRTVQAELEKALSTYARKPITCYFAGRTDSGVHARGQVVHIDWPEDNVDLWRLCWAVNGILPKDLSVGNGQIVPAKFHARHSAQSREYVYKILNRPQRSALWQDTHFFVPRVLDYENMIKAASYLPGEHDFSAFRSTNADKTSPICLLERAEILKLAEGQLEIWIKANHFVYNMVRIIVGTLVEIGLGKTPPDCIERALSQKQRSVTGPTAPPWGLCLEKVKYPENYNLFASDKQATPVARDRQEIEDRENVFTQ
jgi:tRNA pseudouridine38-40 synthase